MPLGNSAMDNRTTILSVVTVIVIFVEILFLHSYNNIQLVDYSAKSGIFSNLDDININSFDIPTRYESASSGSSEGAMESRETTNIDINISDDIVEEENNLQNPNLSKPDIQSKNNTSNNPSSTYAPPVSNIQPDYELDFSKMQNGTSVGSMFRIQNGIDDHWNPSWNNEKQMYRPQNVKIENGALVLIAKVENNGEISSGKVDTQGFFQATYGRFDIVAKMPSGIGTFPAIWMLASNGSYFRDNIATPQEKQMDISWQGDGEIDIMEFLGVEPGFVFHDAHTFNTLLSKKDPNSGVTKLTNPSSEFHTYSIDWKPTSITYLVDGVVKHTITKKSDNIRDWPFNTPFYLILNLAMGGVWNDSILSDQGKTYPNGIDNNGQSGWKMYIKSVKHYSL